MRFQDFAAFDRHLEQDLRSGPSVRSYLFFHPDGQERKYLIEKVLKMIISPSCPETVRCDGRDWDFVYYTLSAPSLFGTDQAVVWDGVKNLPSDLGKRIAVYLANPSPRAFFLFGGDSYKSFASAFSGLEQSIFVLDLGEEKPWDREKRQKGELLKTAKKEGKILDPAALLRICALGGDSSTLESELAKVICYVGDRSLISDGDVAAIAYPSPSSGWDVAEALVWGSEKDPGEIDSASFGGLLSRIRFLITRARDVARAISEGKTETEIGKQLGIGRFPLQKLLSRLRSCRFEYFDEAVRLLYDVELLGKNSASDPEFLSTYLRIQLLRLRKQYAR